MKPHSKSEAMWEAFHIKSSVVCIFMKLISEQELCTFPHFDIEVQSNSEMAY